LALGVQTFTITDDGVANDSLTPTASYVRVTIDETNNAGKPSLSLTETGAKDGDILIIVNSETDGTNQLDFDLADSGGVIETPGGATLDFHPDDVLMLMYVNDGSVSRWTTVSFSNN
jgi:hypothetical protein